MNSLPVLLKKPNKHYYVGADISNDHKGEIFTFCVVEKDPDSEFRFITQQATVVNKNKGDWKRQVETLNEFFNTKTLIESR